MAPISETIEITASPHDVFEYVADLRNLPLWQESVERVAITEPSTDVGTLLAEQRSDAVGSGAFVVADCVRDERLVLVAVEGQLRPEHSLQLEPILDGRSTRVEYAVDYEASGVGMVATARARHRTKQEIKTDLEQLKRQVETAGPAAAAHAFPSQALGASAASGAAIDDTAEHDADAAPGSWREKGDGVVPPIRFY
jgi:uncharacterized membrane protein